MAISPRQYRCTPARKRCIAIIMSTVDEIKSRIDIVDVISAYVKLQRAGRVLKGLSPFQNERTPSFVVYPDSQTFKDYSSGEQGDVFGFLMKKEGLTFPEAMRELAQRAGVHLEERTPEQKKSQDYETRLRAACAETADYFHRLYKSAPQAKACREYVSVKRKLSEATVDAWKIGYSLMEYQSLMSYLETRGFSVKEMIDAGLVIENDEGRRYDRFRGRLMIPISDAKGQIVGFGSRSLDGSEPKYMNSPQTTIFDKGRLLFGLDRARNTIRNEQVSVMVEGYMDVIGTHQAGFTNVVAGMGTSLTEDQFKMLKRLANRIVLALDPDAAGNRAVLRGVEVARETLDRDEAIAFDARGAIRTESKLSADIRVAVMPEGQDPDEIVLDAPDEWRAIVANARPVVEHVIDVMLQAHDIADPKGKSDAVRAVAPVLMDLSDAVQRDFYIQHLARRVQITPRAVTQALTDQTREARNKRAGAQRFAPPVPEAPDADGMDAPAMPPRAESRGIDLETHLLAILWRKPELMMDANVALTRANLDTLSMEDIVSPVMRQAFRQISRMAMGEALQATGDDDAWLGVIADHEAPGHLDTGDDIRLREEAVRTALRLREQGLARERTGVSQMVESARQNGDDEAVARYNLELRQVLSKLLRSQRALQLRGNLQIG
jgi:DNA primase